MDAGYGADTDLRTNITALGLSYVAGIMPQTSVWEPGTGPRASNEMRTGQEPRPKLLRRDAKHAADIGQEAMTFALTSAGHDSQITWLEASGQSHYPHALPVYVFVRRHRDYWLRRKSTRRGLLIEWPDG